jgi:hypothetical protein
MESETRRDMGTATVTVFHPALHGAAFRLHRAPWVKERCELQVGWPNIDVADMCRPPPPPMPEEEPQYIPLPFYFTNCHPDRFIDAARQAVLDHYGHSFYDWSRDRWCVWPSPPRISVRMFSGGAQPYSPAAVQLWQRWRQHHQQPLLGATMRLHFARALCSVHEGAVAAVMLQHASTAHRVVAAVLFDPLRRVAVMGGRTELPRSLGSLLGTAIMRFLGRNSLAATLHRPTHVLNLDDTVMHKVYNNRCVGALTNDGAFLLHPCQRGIAVIRIADGAVMKFLPFHFARQVYVASDGGIIVAHGVAAWDIRPDFATVRNKHVLHDLCPEEQILGACASATFVAASYAAAGIALFDRSGGALLHRIAWITPTWFPRSSIVRRSLTWCEHTQCLCVESDLATNELMHWCTKHGEETLRGVWLMCVSGRSPVLNAHGELCDLSYKRQYDGSERMLFTVFGAGGVDAVCTQMTSSLRCEYIALSSTRLVLYAICESLYVYDI